MLLEDSFTLLCGASTYDLANEWYNERPEGITRIYFKKRMRLIRGYWIKASQDLYFKKYDRSGKPLPGNNFFDTRGRHHNRTTLKYRNRQGMYGGAFRQSAKTLRTTLSF